LRARESKNLGLVRHENMNSELSGAFLVCMTASKTGIYNFLVRSLGALLVSKG